MLTYRAFFVRVIVTTLSTCMNVWSFQAAQKDAAQGEIAEAKTALERATQLLDEHSKAIDMLRKMIAEQRERIARLEQAHAVLPVKESEAPLLAKIESAHKERKWYEKYSFRGYTQFRYNRLFSTNALLTCEQCDRSIGNNNGVFIRRARFILSGEVNDRVFIYFQPDFASTSGIRTLDRFATYTSTSH